MFVRHNLDPNATASDWAQSSGLDWSVETSPVYYRAGNQALVADDKQLLYRSDKPSKAFGVFSNQYTVEGIQPKDMLSFVEQFANETGVTPHSAGHYQEGSKIWAVADNGDKLEFGPNDSIENHLFFGTSYDGTTSTRIGPAPFRPVCQNTLMALLGMSGMYSITHRSKVDWDSVRIWLKNEREEFSLFGDLMREFHNIPVTPVQAADFVKKLVAKDWNPEKEKAPQTVKALTQTIASGIGQREAGANVFGLLNGVTRWVDHDKRARSEDTRQASAAFGPGAALKTAAMDLLIKQCVTKWGEKDRLSYILAETQKYKALAA